MSDRELKQRRSRVGLVSKIYRGQRTRSKRIKYPYPDYTLEDLKEWMFSQPNFEELFINWEKSGYKKDLIPSCDRLNDYKPYTLDNIQLMTWAENNQKGRDDIRNGINTKYSRAVIQYDLDGNFIAEYYSIRNACNINNLHNYPLIEVCKGRRESYSGFIWKYKNESK